MDKKMLIEMARLISIQQAEIDRLKTMLPANKKSKKKLGVEIHTRRLCLITKMYNKQWETALFENADQITFLNQRLLATGLNPFKPDFEIQPLLKGFR